MRVFMTNNGIKGEKKHSYLLIKNFWRFQGYFCVISLATVGKRFAKVFFQRAELNKILNFALPRLNYFSFKILSSFVWLQYCSKVICLLQRNKYWLPKCGSWHFSSSFLNITILILRLSLVI